MMLIPCPWCDERPESEFTYIGEANRQRPDTQDVSASEAQIQAVTDYVFLRTNPKGWHQEYWQHTGGCRGILKLQRNVADHRIDRAVPRDAPLPPHPEAKS